MDPLARPETKACLVPAMLFAVMLSSLVLGGAVMKLYQLNNKTQDIEHRINDIQEQVAKLEKSLKQLHKLRLVQLQDRKTASGDPLVGFPEWAAAAGSQ